MMKNGRKKKKKGRNNRKGRGKKNGRRSRLKKPRFKRGEKMAEEMRRKVERK